MFTNKMMNEEKSEDESSFEEEEEERKSQIFSKIVKFDRGDAPQIRVSSEKFDLPEIKEVSFSNNQKRRMFHSLKKSGTEVGEEL